jgi:DNA-directed RNA polymerase specialized sigma24 family protein
MFLSAIKGLSRFRGTSAFSTWLTAIAAHASLKLLRKRRGLPTTSLDAATEPGDDGEIPRSARNWKRISPGAPRAGS